MDKESIKPTHLWLKCHGRYKCGNCGRMPFYVDISERNICYHCQNIMHGYEGENGEILPVKFAYNRDDEPFGFIWDSFKSTNR